MTSGVCMLLLVHAVLSKSEQPNAYTTSTLRKVTANDNYSRSLLLPEYNYYSISPRGREDEQNGDEDVEGSRTFTDYAEVVLSPDDKLHLEDLGETDPEEVEEAIEEMEPFFAKHVGSMLIAYKLKMLILIPLFVITLFLLAGSSGLAGLFFLLFVGSVWYKHKMGFPLPKHELF